MSSVPGDRVQATRRLSRRAKWDLALGIWGLIYVTLTLAMNLNTPLLSALFVVLAARELLAGRSR